MPVKATYLNEQQIVKYLEKENIDSSICYCKDCGKFLVYDNGVFHINQSTQKLICNDNKLSFLTTRIYNGHEYHLCRCYDCVCKKFPEFKNVRFKFAHKAARYTQYAFDVSDEDFNLVSKARQSITKEKMIKKYGNEEGLRRWKNYCDKQAYTNGFQYKHEKYGMTKEEFDNYNKGRAVALNNLIKRYGIEEGTKHWNSYVERQRYTCSKQYFIEQYGDVEGAEKYDNFCELRSKQILNHPDRFSNIAYELTLQLSKRFSENKIYFGENEFKVKTDEHYYYVDYYDQTLNIVVEFYGDYYHFNPIKYKGDEHYFILNENDKVQDKWVNDEKRINDIQKTLNCKVIIIWESTYRQNKKHIIDLLEKMINEKEKLQNITKL